MFTNNHSCVPLLRIRAQEGRILYNHGITEDARNYFVKSLKYIMIDQTMLMPTDNVNKNPTDATVCRYLFTAKILYMFRVHSTHHPEY